MNRTFLPRSRRIAPAVALADAEVLPHMRAQGRGRIIDLSSVVGFLPSPYMAVYAASKHAIEGYSESLDHEIREHGVRALLVEPAYTSTGFEANSPRPDTPLQVRGPAARLRPHDGDSDQGR